MSLWGGAAFPLLGRGGGGLFSPSTSMTSAPPHLPLPPHMDAHGKPCPSTHSSLRLSHPVTTFSPKAPAAVTVPSPQIRATPVCTRQ